MSDRISEILKNHIANAEKQLSLVREGVSFGGVTDPIPDKEQELMLLIAKWQGELARHEERNANRT